jgi:hypothetical protein
MRRGVESRVSLSGALRHGARPESAPAAGNQSRGWHVPDWVIFLGLWVESSGVGPAH